MRVSGDWFHVLGVTPQVGRPLDRGDEPAPVDGVLQGALGTIQTAIANNASVVSVIEDVDVAEETSKLSRSQVLAQAGVAVLAQANQLPQMALKLLG